MKNSSSEPGFDWVAEEQVSYGSSAADFTNLDAWKLSSEVRTFIYTKVLGLLPAQEQNDLASQMRTSCNRVTQSIARGYGQKTIANALPHYHEAKAELFAVKDQVLAARELGYISTQDQEEGLALIGNARSKLGGYIKYLYKKKQTTT